VCYRKSGYTPLGIDLSEELLEAGRHRFPEPEFRKMDATCLELPDCNQLTNPVGLEWFIRYPEGETALYLHSAPPYRTVRQLETVGFEIAAVRGVKGSRIRPTRADCPDRRAISRWAPW